jgi:hypothetical protein
LEPALTLDSGDKGHYYTPDVLWGIDNYKEGDLSRRKFGPQEPPRNKKPSLVDPVAVRGDETVEALEILPR